MVILNCKNQSIFLSAHEFCSVEICVGYFHFMACLLSRPPPPGVGISTSVLFRVGSRYMDIFKIMGGNENTFTLPREGEIVTRRQKEAAGSGISKM